MKAFFEQLFEYNHSMNQQVGMLLKQQDALVFQKSTEMFGHIINAHHIWISRLAQLAPIYTTWQPQRISDSLEIDMINFAETLPLIHNLELGKTVPGLTVKGRPCFKSAAETLFHVINHSTYHRAQIATELRRNGVDPITTDFILYEKP